MARVSVSMGTMLVASLVSAFAAHSAHATPSISWSFTPSPVSVLPTDDVDIVGTFTNTGTTTITGIAALVVTNYGSVGPYVTGWTWNPTFWTDYTGLAIDPGESFSFFIANEAFVNAPIGSYTATDTTYIGVVDTLGDYSGNVVASNDLVLDVPEPSALALTTIALLGLGLVRRRSGAGKA